MCVRMRACVCAFVRAPYVRTCVRAPCVRARACVRACARVRACVCVCVCACVSAYSLQCVWVYDLLGPTPRATYNVDPTLSCSHMLQHNLYGQVTYLFVE